MTDREKAIVMAHTGICTMTGDSFQIFHKYVEDIMGRPIMTHEMGLFADEIMEKSTADFIALCADESSSENPKIGRWERDQFTNQPTCSVCGYKVFGGQTNYCPNCGAKMSEILTGAEGE